MTATTEKPAEGGNPSQAEMKSSQNTIRIIHCSPLRKGGEA